MLGAQPIARTNHCLSEPLRALEGEAPNTSTHKRLTRMQQVLAQGGHDLASIRALYSDRSDGVNSICRYPEDDQGTATNACIVCEPETRRIWACRGPADRGDWQELHFERG